LAADQGNLQAQNDLGMCYEKGLGVPKQLAEAVRLYRCAAERGHDGAQYNLAACYSEGVGVPQDKDAARRLLKLAAEQQCEEAAIALDQLDSCSRRESFWRLIFRGRQAD
jgi:TPR repeat protein